MANTPDDPNIRNMMQKYIGSTRQVREVKSTLRSQAKTIQASIDNDKKQLINFMLMTNKGYLNDSPPFLVLRAKKRKGGWNDDRIRAFIEQFLRDLQEGKNNGTNEIDYGTDMFKRWREQYETVFADIEESSKRPRFRTCEQLRNQLIEQGEFNPSNAMQT